MDNDVVGCIGVDIASDVADNVVSCIGDASDIGDIVVFSVVVDISSDVEVVTCCIRIDTASGVVDDAG